MVSFSMIIRSKMVAWIGLGALVLLAAFTLGFLGPHRVLNKTSFEKLPDWSTSDHGAALYAFQESCGEILKQDARKKFGKSTANGSLSDWQTICKAAIKMVRYDKNTAQTFFETWFEPYSVGNNFSMTGLFTGYYLPLIHVSFKQDEQHTTPIYGVPRDLIKIDLGSFSKELDGKTVVAKLENHQLTPYPDRSEIQQGALQNTAPVIAWSDNPVDVYFAQVQGSAQIETPDKKMFLISYAGDNGRPYTSIGKILLRNKELTKEEMSMQSIRKWLETNPDQAQALMNNDASYVFFDLQPLDAPVGTEKIPLTPERTLAVDTNYIPLGAPVWLETSVPRKDQDELQPFRQLMIAQDSGGAIRGIVRGDVYWGPGEDAAYTAGHMQSRGRYWILLPKTRS